MFEPAAATGEPASVYMSHGPGYRVQLSPARLDLAFQVPGGTRAAERGGLEQRASTADESARLALGMELVGGNSRAEARAEQDLPTCVNYYVGNDPRAWRTNVRTHARIRYVGVYPGIDVVFYGNQRQLEHDFEVAPGIDPGQIRWRFVGADHWKLESDGSLVVEAGSTSLSFRPPQVYQWYGGKRRIVPAAYRLEGGSAAVVGFELAAYDPARALVIDPILAYSAYLGGLGYEQASGVAVDQGGQVYVAGETSSTNFPVANALWPNNQGGYAGIQNPYGNDAFVAKLGPEGTNLIFATYLGGNGVDAAIAVALDSEGNPVIAGLTGSTNFPVTASALQGHLASASDLGYYFNDAFVTKLSADGGVLLYSTYIGGTNDDLGLAIATDTNGAIYLAGDTESGDFPIRNNGSAYGGGADAFVLKFTPGAGDWSYSMVLGGTQFDFAQSLAVDSAGSAYVTGDTGSFGFPVTNALQSAHRGGTYDAFISKLSPAGDRLLFSTFIGGTDVDEGFGIAVDAEANAFVTGYTRSRSFPTTNALYAAKASGSDAFLVKVNPAGQLLYSSFLGGKSDDQGWAIALDAGGGIHIVGMTQSSDFPLTNGLQMTYQGGRDLFITKFQADGHGLVYSTFLGGTKEDQARSLALDAAGSAYVAGFTASSNFPLRPALNPMQPNYGGGIADAFVLKIVPEATLIARQSAPGVIVVGWPAGLANYALESNVDLLDPNNWMSVTGESSVSFGLRTFAVTNLVGHDFYRLRQVE